MRIKEGFVLRPFADGWIAVSAAEPEAPIVSLNKVGAFVWQVLQEDMCFDAVIEKLTEKYDVDEAEARRDLELFVKVADDAGLLIKES